MARMFKPGIKVPGLGYHMVPILYATVLFCTTVRNSCGFRPVPGCVSCPIYRTFVVSTLSHYIHVGYRFVAV